MIQQTNNKVNTDEQITEIRFSVDSPDAFARAIEQAVLQSPEVQALRDALEEMVHRAHPADVVGDFPSQKLIEAREQARTALSAMEKKHD